uniref:Abhydrolase domain containing 15 n=1 Tax=Gopherus evgoodei TaxID=1825980 RepID=A0A8C4VZF7_9SAUR
MWSPGRGLRETLFPQLGEAPHAGTREPCGLGLGFSPLCLLATELWGPGRGSLLPSGNQGVQRGRRCGTMSLGRRGLGQGTAGSSANPPPWPRACCGASRRGHCPAERALAVEDLAKLQTTFQLLFPPAHQPELARELLQLADGGLVALDWVVGPRGTGKRSRATTAFGSPPVLLVLPNASGKVTRGVLHLCLLALEQGYKPVIFNRRGHNGSPLASLNDIYPCAAACLLSYLGECGSSSYLAAAACISPVFRCQEWLEDRVPLRTGNLPSTNQHFHTHVVETGRLFRSRSLREFEETLFCQTKRHPVTWDAYWDRNDPLREVDEAAVPVLCICSADDPVRGPPANTLPMELFHSSPYFFLLLTPHGGHCGFLREGPCSWSHEVTLEYFTAVHG